VPGGADGVGRTHAIVDRVSDWADQSAYGGPGLGLFLPHTSRGGEGASVNRSGGGELHIGFSWFGLG